MKAIFALCVLKFVALSSAKPQADPTNCIDVPGEYPCPTITSPGQLTLDEFPDISRPAVPGHHHCEKGTHVYATGCGPLTPEATCVEPNPREQRAIICDYSACYCDKPTVRDTESGKCVTLDQCPKKRLLL